MGVELRRKACPQREHGFGHGGPVARRGRMCWTEDLISWRKRATPFLSARAIPKGRKSDVHATCQDATAFWFNNCLGHQSSAVPVPAPQAHRAFQLSDERAEREAIQWAHAGLVTLSDVMAGTTFMGPSAFRQRYPQLVAMLSSPQCTAPHLEPRTPRRLCRDLGGTTGPTRRACPTRDATRDPVPSHASRA